MKDKLNEHKKFISINENAESYLDFTMIPGTYLR